MSLTREAIQESKDYLRDNCAHVFGQKFYECRLVSACQLSTKADKFESKFVVLSKFRLFVIHGKNHSFKTEKSFNLLALRLLGETNEKELTIGYEDKPKSITKFVYRSEDVSPSEMARELLAALKHYFPDIGPCLPKFMDIQPDKLLNEFPALPNSQPSLPCHNFRRSYVAYCDYIEQPFKDEVFWDIERIYFSHHVHEIRLDDFSHLTVRDQVAILGSAQFSSYFTGILVDGIRLQPDHVDTILNVIRRSTSLKSLKLTNCGLLKDFPQLLGNALFVNPTLPLTILDLSGNALDDKKSISHLANVLPKFPILKSISFADCGLSEKSIHHLLAGLNTGLTIDTNITAHRFELKRLVLARCSLKDEASELVNFVSVCGSLRSLDLSGTGILVDRLWSALKFGGLQLEQLNLSGCQSSKKMVKESCTLVKELFSCMVNLEELNLCGTQLNGEVLRGILQGLSNNSQLSNIRLNLDGVCGDRSCYEALEQHLPNCPVAFLSLRDNNLEQEAMKIIVALKAMKTLQSLDIGGTNFTALKANKKSASMLTKTIAELTKLISMENSNLKELIISDTHLGSMLNIIFGGLGDATIEQLDVCGNEIGNFGARLLSKALQLNTSVRVLALDRNQITGDGFAEVAHALRLNHALESIPYPSLDIGEALARPDRARVLNSISEIEAALARNRTEPRWRDKCVQRLMQTLNRHSNLYDVDSSSQKKIIFHNLMKVAAELDDESMLSVSTHGLVENFLSNLLVLGKDNEQRFMSHLQKRLADYNVELSDGASTHKNGDKELEKSARTQIRQFIEQFLIESAFQNATNQLDRLLSQPEGLRLCGTFLNSSNIDNSVLIGQSTSRTNQIAQTHRPHSTVFASEESPKRNGVHAVEAGNGLLHLAKSRPPPPRMTKQNGTRQNGTATTILDNHSAMNSSTHSSTTASSSDHPTPPSPRLRTALSQHSNTNNQHQAAEDSPEPSAPPLPQTTPPPLVPRRGVARLSTPNQPPRLPPKPSTQSPTELRNHKTLVLPALEVAREMYASDDSS